MRLCKKYDNRTILFGDPWRQDPNPFFSSKSQFRQQIGENKFGNVLAQIPGDFRYAPFDRQTNRPDAEASGSRTIAWKVVIRLPPVGYYSGKVLTVDSVQKYPRRGSFRN
jgi:hypothetical protein